MNTLWIDLCGTLAPTDDEFIFQVLTLLRSDSICVFVESGKRRRISAIETSMAMKSQHSDMFSVAVNWTEDAEVQIIKALREQRSFESWYFIGVDRHHIDTLSKLTLPSRGFLMNDILVHWRLWNCLVDFNFDMGELGLFCRDEGRFDGLISLVKNYLEPYGPLSE